MTLKTFMARCEGYFAWSGCLVDQPFQERLGEGLLRCYLSGEKVVGFCHQWPKALLDDDPRRGATAVPVMEGPDGPAYQGLRVLLESQWVPQTTNILGVPAKDLPAIWDADLLYGPRTPTAGDSYVLCEINVTAVWPFPPMAAPRVAAAAMEGASSAGRGT